MIKNILSKIKNEHGAVQVVEAAMVYPIVFFVVIIFLFLGNMYYQQAQIDSVTVRAAEKLASYYVDSMLYEGIPTNSEQTKLNPYRYLFGNSTAETKVKSFIKTEMSKIGTGFFPGMEPQYSINTCKINNYVVYQTANVQINYTINFELMGLIDGITFYKTSSATSVAAGDPAELIRNVDMILDYSEITGLTDKIRQFVGQFK